MKQYLLCILLLIISCNLIAQKNPDTIDLALDKYYENPREAIFLHINKTDFIKGEIMWFKGYIRNQQSSKPFIETSNVHITLYDSLGKSKEQKLFLAKNGYLSGSIKLDSTYSSGNYYIKAETSWMQNFKDSKPFLEKFSIVDETVLSNKTEVINYDVQFLPEGGNMLVGSSNVIGVKSVNNYGYGVKITNGKILDQDGEILTSFNTQVHGLGKFLLTPIKGKKYSAIIEFDDGSKNTYDLPEPNLRGITITVKNNFAQDKIAITFKTNKESLDLNNSLIAYFLLHKEDNSFVQKIEFDKSNLSQSILLNKASMETGVNTITLFTEDYQPILERKFFNNYGFKLPEVKLATINRLRDSISLEFNVNSNSDNFNISISALPIETTTNPTNNIASEFHLKPYVEGFIEKPSYYFENFSAEKSFYLDLLLLNQGWNRYEWREIFKGPNQVRRPFENGLTIIGNLNKGQKRENEILFHNSKYHLMKTIKLPENENTFTMPGMFIEEGEKLKFSLIDRKGKLTKPSLNLRIQKDYIPEDLEFVWFDNAKNTLKDFSVQEFLEFGTNLNAIELNPVELTGKKKEVIPRTNPVPAYLESKVTLVDQELIRNFPYITDLIRSNGYYVREDLQGYDGGSGPISKIQISSRRNNAGLLLVLDGMRMYTNEELANLPTSRIESFFFDRKNRYEGIRAGFNEVLYVFTRRGPSLESINKKVPDNILNFTSKIVFEKSKEYYSPKYTNYNSEPFKKFGFIHWIPVLKTTDNQMKFKLPDFGVDKLKLFIEGMNPDGAIISKIITLDLKEN